MRISGPSRKFKRNREKNFGKETKTIGIIWGKFSFSSYFLTRIPTGKIVVGVAPLLQVHRADRALRFWVLGLGLGLGLGQGLGQDLGPRRPPT